MKGVNFFLREHTTEEPHTEPLRYVYDPEGESPVYTSIVREEAWVAMILNPDSEEYLMIPVDKNISFGNDPSKTPQRCDGMILKGRALIFFELKNQKTDWISRAVSQLESTIDVFKANHYCGDYQPRRAYAANRCHPFFHSSCRQMLQEFRNRTGFALELSNQIKI